MVADAVLGVIVGSPASGRPDTRNATPAAASQNQVFHLATSGAQTAKTMPATNHPRKAGAQSRAVGSASGLPSTSTDHTGLTSPITSRPPMSRSGRQRRRHTTTISSQAITGRSR
ncbi:Uncharacterised protein [Mycobacteroides abscessus subsp. abscessus]|nr:Uncharacterised protein [Mycobacteroides abscessus subsp. abscessus]